MRVLYITTSGRTGGWLAEAFAADSAAQILLEEAVGTAAGLARLREEAFDAVLVSHEPGELDALELIEGYRAGGAEEPIVVLGTSAEQEMAVLGYEVGADGYVCVHTATTRQLIWTIARAVGRHQLVGESRRLKLSEQTRLGREHEEARCLIEQQHAIIGEAETPPQRVATACGPPVETFLPAELIVHYRELLRTYVIMGSGNLGGELRCLARLLVSAGMTSAQVMRLHLHVLEELVHGLGERSTRHVMTRADLLIIELMIHLADGYRGRYQQGTNLPRQRMLPGFE